MRGAQYILISLVIVAALIFAARIKDDPENGTSPGPAQTSSGAAIADVDGARIRAADAEPHNWMSHGRTYGEQRFSPLDQINADNVAQLGLAWSFDLQSVKGIEATPLVVDGVMYTTGIWNEVLALDAATGAERWRHDPKIPKSWARYACCGAVNRGPAIWRGRIYVGLIDGRLIALDAATGTLQWEVHTTDPDEPYSITGAPRVINDKIIIGNGGAEFGVRGYVTAYDAASGAEVWRFYTVPGDPALGFESEAMAMAAKTWSGEWWTAGGGGTAWDSFAFDPELNLLYIGTGNGSPWARDLRSPGGGDNLFLSSIVAVDADTGAYRWHYQTTPSETWDYTATQPMILADLAVDGAVRKVLMQAPKNGFFYVLDRATGELISAEPFVPVNWASHVDPATGRPVEIAENVPSAEAKLVTPGPHGAHDWQPMSFSPLTGLVYIPAHEMWWSYSQAPSFSYRPGVMNLGQNAAAAAPAEAAERLQNGRGHLLAWDPVTQTAHWRIEMGRGWNGGVLTTAGNLLVQGTADGNFVVRAADSGRELWRLPVRTGVVAGPISYAVNGEQYLMVAAGWTGAASLMGGGMSDIHRGPSRLLAFKLDGTATLPPLPPSPVMPEPPAQTADNETIARGAGLYAGTCGSCHGFDAISGGTIADLRYMTAATHAAFEDIVLGGILDSAGMASFEDVFDTDEVRAIHAYIIQRARETYRPDDRTRE